jgi:hypothetical protein
MMQYSYMRTLATYPAKILPKVKNIKRISMRMGAS